MEKIDVFYKKFNGSYFGFIGVGILAITTLIATILYMLVDPSFSIFTHWVSDLGAGPNNANIVFNLGAILTGIILIFFFLYLTRYLQEKGGNKAITWLMFIAGFILSIGRILVGLFPIDLLELHRIAATIYFYAALPFWILLGISEILTPDIPKLQAFTPFITAISIAIFIILMIPLRINPAMNDELAKFTEWMVFFIKLSLLFEQGIYTLKAK